VAKFDAAACAELLAAMTAIGVRAAIVIRAASSHGGVRYKEDGSPVTAADIEAEGAIRAGLVAVAPALPIVSEEEAVHRHMAAGASYFLVDPLDGTREFISGSDEYVIAIALMSDGAPIAGVIVAPALGNIWRGAVGCGAARLAFAADAAVSAPERIQTRTRPQQEPVTLVSRSHLDPRTQAYLQSLPQPRTIACGSALKFCRIAEGSADIYPRLAPTHDWDVAAGHAIVVAAGGQMLAPGGTPLRYGTPELLIPDFIASGEVDGSAS
jgi:3'(2'), 5'-bisphosphate nucleotidase